jgi:hypothetical protein
LLSRSLFLPLSLTHTYTHLVHVDLALVNDAVGGDGGARGEEHAHAQQGAAPGHHCARPLHERFGVQSLAAWLTSETALAAQFIDIDSPV